MASITLTRGNTLPDSSAKSDFHNLVDLASASISNIENSDVSNSAAIAASKLNLATVAQTIAMSSKAINYAKGSDIASATTTDIGAATGNFVDVTGTTTITGLGTVQAGTIRFVRFTGILTLTHNGTSLILPTTANITTAANDRAIFASLGSGNWICLAYQKADGTPLGSAYTPTAANALSGSVIQTVYGESAAAVSVTATFTYDDTPPLYSEGNLVISGAITPTNASNKIRVRFSGSGIASTGLNAICYLTIGTGSTASIQTVPQGNAITNGWLNMYLDKTVTAAGTSQITFYVLCAVDTGTLVISSSSYWGDTAFITLTLEEIKA